MKNHGKISPSSQKFREIIKLITPQIWHRIPPLLLCPAVHQPLLGLIYSSQWEGNNKNQKKTEMTSHFITITFYSGHTVCTTKALGTANDSNKISLISISGCRQGIKIAYGSLYVKIERDWQGWILQSLKQPPTIVRVKKKILLWLQLPSHPKTSEALLDSGEASF